MVKALTVKSVEHAKAGTVRKEIPDGLLERLYLVVQPSGKKSWVVRYRFQGKPKKLTLGPYPAIELDNARDLARPVLIDVARGKDPAGEKQQAKIEAKKPVRKKPRSAEVEFEKVANDFIERYAKVKQKDWKNTESFFLRQWIPAWKGMSIHDIRKRDVLDVLDELVENGGGPSVNRSFSQLRKCFNWLVENDRLPVSPMNGLKKPVDEKARTRYLSDYEIYLFWTVISTFGYPFEPIYKTLLFTGQRLTEVAAAQWSEFGIDRENHWHLSEDRTKNERPQELLVPKQVTQLLTTLPRFSYIDEKGATLTSPYLFTTTGYSPVQGFSNKKEEIILAMNALAEKNREEGRGPKDYKFQPFIIHDLRRTFSTNMGKMQVRVEVIEAALNHVSGAISGVAAVYNQWKYFEEKGKTLQEWADYVDHVVALYSSDNVVRLRTAG